VVDDVKSVGGSNDELELREAVLKFRDSKKEDSEGGWLMVGVVVLGSRMGAVKLEGSHFVDCLWVYLCRGVLDGKEISGSEVGMWGICTAHEARVPSLGRVTHKNLQVRQANGATLAHSTSALTSAFAPIFPHSQHAFSLRCGPGLGRILKIGITRNSAFECVWFDQDRKLRGSTHPTIPTSPKSGVSL